MNSKIIKFLDNYSDDAHDLNSLIVCAFLFFNRLEVKNNLLIKNYMKSCQDNKKLKEFITLYKEYSEKMTFENVIELFEICIPKKEQVINGAIYTPNFIKEFIVDHSFQKIEKPIEEALFADISCGCGAFLISLAQKIHTVTGRSFSSIFQENVYGIDISPHSIERSKIVLSLYAIVNSEDTTDFSFNLFIGNSLDFDWNKECSVVQNNKGFDCIVGNPPYVRAKHIDSETKKLLKHWDVTKTGNPDLYIAFFEIGLKNLNSSGILGYIIANTFIRSLNARSLRNYFSRHQNYLEILDFGNEQIFRKKSTYTCICFISHDKENAIKYAKISSKDLQIHRLPEFINIEYRLLNDEKWIFSNSHTTIENIKKIEKCGTPLGKLYPIKNGLATLANKIYIFRPVSEDDQYYLNRLNNKNYWIEKGICRNIIKPNILKTEAEIESLREKIIFPYIKVTGSNGKESFEIINEIDFQTCYPRAYQYLTDHKHILSQRDKGKGNYSAWYAFGRTQAFTLTGKKLLFPYIDKEPHFVYTDDENMLIYCGYGIYSKNEKELKILKKILESDVFWYYIRHNAKPYSNEYYSIAKNYVKNFGICDLNQSERKFLQDSEDKEEIYKFLVKKYNLIFD